MSDPSGPGGRAVKRVVVWGTCDTGKPRVRILLQGLRENGVEVIECRSNPWQGIEDKSQIGARRWLAAVLRTVGAYPMLLWRYLRLPAHDWVLLGYPAIPDIFVIRLFAWLRGAPVAMDWFLSAYDTIVLDRRLVGRRHPLAALVYAVEWVAVRLADCVFMDTATHARRLERLFGLAEGRFGRVWVGVESESFGPVEPFPSAKAGGKTRILFYGQFIPLHGIATIIEAATLLREEPVEWRIIGRGQEAGRIREMLRRHPVPALAWIEWVDYEDLQAEIRSAHVCLGIFGSSDKAASVIPNKVFQILATGKPLITRRSKAIEELIDRPYPDVVLVPAADAQALSGAIRGWRASARLAEPARNLLLESIRAKAIGAQCIAMLDRAKP